MKAWRDWVDEEIERRERADLPTLPFSFPSFTSTPPSFLPRFLLPFVQPSTTSPTSVSSLLLPFPSHLLSFQADSLLVPFPFPARLAISSTSPVPRW